MRTNVVKYELLSTINMCLQKKDYCNSLPDVLKNYSFYIKDLEYDIDNTAEDIEFDLKQNNNIKECISLHLKSLKQILKENLNIDEDI